MNDKLPAILVIGVLLLGGALIARKYLSRARPATSTAVTATPAPAMSPAAVPAAPPPQPEQDAGSMSIQIESQVSQNPNDHATRMTAARLYLQVGLNAQAIPHLQAATRIKPKDAITWVALGDTATLADKL